MGLFGGGEDLSSTRMLEARIARLEATVASLEARLARAEVGLPDTMVQPGYSPPPAPTGLPYADPGMAEVLRLRQAGQMIPAIKLYRQLTGAGLAEAKTAVESM
jgi:ribosomal protein L7/L12